MLVDEMRRRLLEAMRAGDARTKSILRVALGDVESEATRRGGDLADADVQAIVRKLVKSNQESRDAARDAETRTRLEEEIAILTTLLPRTLSVDQIVEALGPVADRVRAAAGDGPATGIAMKHLKGAGAAVEGRDVADAVRRLRG